jgi:parallel beta-helix repeat protein
MYTSIQQAIDVASDGDTVFVHNGIYYENLIINKKINLIGENKNLTIIDGQYKESVIIIESSNVNISGFTITNSSGYKSDAGVHIISDNTHISNCNFFRTRSAVYLNSSNENIIENCIFYKNGEGIYILKNHLSIIRNNYFLHNAIGITILNSSHINIENNYVTVNGIGCYIEYSYNIIFNQNAFYNNNDNQGAIFIKYCENLTFEKSILQHNGIGIGITGSNNIDIINSTIKWNTHFGLKVKDQSKNIIIKYSKITENYRFGIYSENSKSLISNCNLYANLVGLYLDQSTCNAQNNWWGWNFGPILFENKQIDKIKIKSSNIQIIPSLSEKISNAGASWEIDTEKFQKPHNMDYKVKIRFNETDTDSDGIPDWWEEKYNYNPNEKEPHDILDPDSDGLVNIQECFTDKWGSNPYKKDIFWEFDWMESQMSPEKSNKPSDKFISHFVDEFASHDINLHVDIGNLEGGEIIDYQNNFTYAVLRDIYWDNFLHNDLTNPRKEIFHYGIICDNGPFAGFAFIGWDHLDSFCISAETLESSPSLYPRDLLIAGGSIHELGHTLGLNVDDHGGNDNKIATWYFTFQWFKYLQYRSCMNYWYTYKVLTFSDATMGKYDFNDWEHMDLTFFKNTHFNPSHIYY